MSTRPKMRRDDEPKPSRVDKNFEEVAERVFRDDSPGEPLYGDILEEPDGEAA